MGGDALLWVVVASALAFGFTNGFQDTGSLVATAISTRAMQPRTAVTLAALLNFAGALLSLEVAATVATGIVDAAAIGPAVVAAGLMGAILWNLASWGLGLPSSSSHALLGGLVGATLAARGTGAVLESSLLANVLIPALLAPALALMVAAIAIVVAHRLVGRLRPGPVSRGFRAGQSLTGGLLSLAHGSNDAQKAMGIIFLALVAGGTLAPGADVPPWVILFSAGAIAAGTYAGGSRLLKSPTTRIKLDPAQGFAAQASGAAVVLSATAVGFPLSTTHVVSGAVLGAGAAQRGSPARRGVAASLLAAWLLTLPLAAVVGGLAFGVLSLTGSELGAAALAVALPVLAAVAVATRSRRPRPDRRRAAH